MIVVVDLLASNVHEVVGIDRGRRKCDARCLAASTHVPKPPLFYMLYIHISIPTSKGLTNTISVDVTPLHMPTKPDPWLGLS